MRNQDSSRNSSSGGSARHSHRLPYHPNTTNHTPRRSTFAKYATWAVLGVITASALTLMAGLVRAQAYQVSRMSTGWLDTVLVPDASGTAVVGVGMVKVLRGRDERRGAGVTVVKPIFADGFDTGNTLKWSLTVPTAPTPPSLVDISTVTPTTLDVRRNPNGTWTAHLITTDPRLTTIRWYVNGVDVGTFNPVTFAPPAGPSVIIQPHPLNARFSHTR